MAETRVDVVIPVYGSPDYLAEAIDSVLLQDYADFRVMVMQNGPGEEEAREITGRYSGDPRVSYETAGRTLTQRESWERCLRRTSAPYVAMLHEDDRFLPGYLKRRVEFLDAHPECGFVFSSMTDIDERGDEVWVFPHRLAEGVHQPRDFVPLLLEEMIIGSPTPLVRRTAYEDVGMDFTDAVKNIDWDMWLRIALRHPVGYLAVRDCERRVHGGSVTAVAPGWGEEKLRLVSRFEELVARELPDLPWSERGRRRWRADGHLTEAVDALSHGEADLARRHIRTAVGIHGPAIADPRVAGTMALLAAGDRGRAAIDLWRAHRGQQRFGLNAHDLRRLGRDLLLRAARG